MFIQTSRFEGMPMGILEALSYGLPCLVTEGTTLGTFVSQNKAGWSCETDASKIAEAMRAAIQEKGTWTQKSDRARHSVSEQFAWERVAEEMIFQYRKYV